MSKTYEFKKIDSIVGDKASFYYLIIDGKNKFVKFYDKHKTNFEIEFDYIQALMQQVSEGLSLPETKYRQIKGHNLDCLYEFKKKKIRVYCLKIKPNFFVVCAGFKDDEKTDYDTLRAIANDFLKSGMQPTIDENNNNE